MSLRPPSRRLVLKRCLCAGVALGVLPDDVPGQEDPAAMRPQVGDLLVKDADRGLTPLTPADVRADARQTLAWSLDAVTGLVRNGSRLNLLVLVRLEPERMAADTLARAADGVLAYTAICTHTGCEVEEWDAEPRLLSCPCHVSRFDPADGARVVDGPAPRPLPALPLGLVDGQLVVAGPFTSRVGFDPGDAPPR